MTKFIDPATHLIPHSGKMAQLKRIIDYGEDWIRAEADLTADNIFAENGRIPAWAALEILAQGIAALAGIRAEQAGEPVRPGFLLGTRKFTASVAHLPLTTVTINVQESMVDERGFGVYRCVLTDGDGITLADAAINAFSPSDIEQFMQTQTGN